MSAPDGPMLLVAGGPLEGRSIPVRGSSGEHVLGSAPSANLVLEAANVEAAHAWLIWDERGVFVNDAGTQSGTFLNGERVEQELELKDGDRVSLGPPGDPGSVKLLVHLPGHPANYPAEETLASVPEEPLMIAVSEPEPPAPEPPVPSAPDRGVSEAAKAAAESGEWGAVDDDDEVIKIAPAPVVVKPAPPPPPPPKPAATHAPAHPPVRVPTPAPSRTMPPARAITQPVPRVSQRRHHVERPPASRVLLVGIGAALLAGVGVFFYFRSQAPGPQLIALLPPTAEPGQTIQINGSGFEEKPEGNAVSFGDAPAQVTSATAQQLSVVVPASLSPDAKAEHRVRVKARGANSNALFFRVYVGPKVAALEPDVAMPGDVVRANGENFGDDTAVTVAGIAAEIVETKPTALRFRVPKIPAAPGKTVPVSLRVGKTSARSVSLLIGTLPLVLEVSPDRGVPGDRVVVKGRGFDPAPGGSAVSFGGRPSLVLSASERELQVAVPGSPGQQELPIAVRAAGAASTGTLMFKLNRVSRGEFVPRFYPEPGPNPETVFVSSDLGPFLRLRGKADAANAAERGARAAAALNAAFEQAARGAVTIEVKDKPEPAVALAGGATILVAKAEDGAAYEGARPSARALARYWAALLQDYVSLFVQRQRPLRVLELSPRGQALLELYAAAERRAGVGSGVPTSVVENLSQSQLRALAEMALSVPAEGQAVSGAAVAGRWDGTLEEIGQPTHAIQVRIRAGASLAGSLTRRSGSISGEVPLQDASYKDGILRFVARMGTVPMHFQGKVDGRSIAGQIQSADGKPRGSFSLRWVE